MTYCYDPLGLVVQVVDPNNNSNKSSYTADNHVATTTDTVIWASAANGGGPVKGSGVRVLVKMGLFRPVIR